MDLQLAGKRAFVTGASSGLGVAIAKTLAAEGAAVACHGRNADRTAETVRAIEATGGRAVAAVGGLTDDAEVERLAALAVEALGGIDILVHNAGGALHNDDVIAWEALPSADYLDSLNINFVAATRLARAFAPGMCARGWGRIINISSIAGRQALGVLHEYGPAKAALENWSLNISKNLAPHGVTVNCIEPGMYLTEASQSFLLRLRDEHGWPDDMEEVQRRYATDIFPQPIRRLGRPEEMGALVAFLASPLSGYTTGATWRADGGTSMAL